MIVKNYVDSHEEHPLAILQLAIIWIVVLTFVMYLMVMTYVYFVNKTDYIKAQSLEEQIKLYYMQNKHKATKNSDTSCFFKPEYQTIIDSLFSNIKSRNTKSESSGSVQSRQTIAISTSGANHLEKSYAKDKGDGTSSAQSIVSTNDQESSFQDQLDEDKLNWKGLKSISYDYHDDPKFEDLLVEDLFDQIDI